MQVFKAIIKLSILLSYHSSYEENIQYKDDPLCISENLVWLLLIARGGELPWEATPGLIQIKVYVNSTWNETLEFDKPKCNVLTWPDTKYAVVNMFI